MKTKIPPVGEVVLRNGQEDWLTQRRIGDEQFVLWWGGSKSRWREGDTWEVKP